VKDIESQHHIGENAKQWVKRQFNADQMLHEVELLLTKVA